LIVVAVFVRLNVRGTILGYKRYVLAIFALNDLR
jgi:hypothetical protein